MWRELAGAGGYKNDNYSPMAFRPDGTLYQGTPLGIVWMRDTPAVEAGVRVSAWRHRPR